MKGLKLGSSIKGISLSSTAAPLRQTSSVEVFRTELRRHQALAERHHYCLSLLLFEVGAAEIEPARPRRVASAILKCIRSTDQVGWFDDNHIGAILPYCPSFGAPRPAKRVCQAIGTEQAPTYIVYTYPSERGPYSSENPVESPPSRCAETQANEVSANCPKSCGNATESHIRRGRHHCSCKTSVQGDLPVERLEMWRQYAMPTWKRATDILGSVLGLALLSPLFLAAGLLIKSVSKGPVFFRQQRVGYMGKTFRLWKFRTYEHNTDTTQHERYVSSLINVARQEKDAPQLPMKKLDKAPGVIAFGKVLRKTCIDELPQLINVLFGEMSLVGPRPAMAYEVEQYADWHKGRLYAIPGMTGLWQVSGKNRLTFNEMVRLDIQYAMKKSFWFDIKIVLKTPLAIVSQIQDSLQGTRSGIAGNGQYQVVAKEA